MNTAVASITCLGGSAQLLDTINSLGGIDCLPQGCLVAMVHSFLEATLNFIYHRRHGRQAQRRSPIDSTAVTTLVNCTKKWKDGKMEKGMGFVRFI